MADYDLAIIGGGINGVSVARDAAGRGLRVLLLEQGDLGGAASSATSRLIHGDLSVLERRSLPRVRTQLAERDVWLKIAPHVVRPMRFALPGHSEERALLRRLKALGVRISMDDFGSGYSSLSYLQAFPFDKIKVDRAFVINLGRNPQSAAIISAVIDLGHGLGMSLVAEGVETLEQLAFLADEGCDAVQGYLIGKPLPIGQYAVLVGRAATNVMEPPRKTG